MKKIFLLLMIILTGIFARGQSPTYDTVKLKRGGKVFTLIIYSGATNHTDSVNINGKMFYVGWKYKQGNPNVLVPAYPGGNALISYPGIRSINGSGKPKKSALVIWHKGDDILYSYDTVPHTGPPGCDPCPDVVIDSVFFNTIFAYDAALHKYVPVKFPHGIIADTIILSNGDTILLRDMDLSQYRKLNNPDSLSHLKEKKYQSLTGLPSFPDSIAKYADSCKWYIDRMGNKVRLRTPRSIFIDGTLDSLLFDNYSYLTGGCTNMTFGIVEDTASYGKINLFGEGFYGSLLSGRQGYEHMEFRQVAFEGDYDTHITYYHYDTKLIDYVWDLIGFYPNFGDVSLGKSNRRWKVGWFKGLHTDTLIINLLPTLGSVPTYALVPGTDGKSVYKYAWPTAGITYNQLTSWSYSVSVSDAKYEVVSSKSTNSDLGTSNTYYPSQKAVKTYVDNSLTNIAFSGFRWDYNNSLSSGKWDANASYPIATTQIMFNKTDYDGVNMANWLESSVGNILYVKDQKSDSIYGIYSVNSYDDEFLPTIVLFVTMLYSNGLTWGSNVEYFYIDYKGEGQIQSDWNQNSTGALDYIKNKPFIPTSICQLIDECGAETTGIVELDNGLASIYPKTDFEYIANLNSSGHAAGYNWSNDNLVHTSTLTSGYYTKTVTDGKESLSNKSTSNTLGSSDVLYPSQNAVKTYADNGLSGKAATNQTMYIGTTSQAINRGSAAESLTGINIDGSSGSCTGNAATVTNGVYKTLIIWDRGTGYDSTQLVLDGQGYNQMTLGISQGMVIDTAYFIVIGAAVNLTVKLWYGMNPMNTGTAIVTAGNNITSIGVTRVSSFNNATIPAGNCVWSTLSAITTKCRRITFVIRGHLS
jgi:hypothetical protein